MRGARTVRAILLLGVAAVVLGAASMGHGGGPATGPRPNVTAAQTPLTFHLPASADPSVQASAKPLPADVGSSLNFYSLVTGVTGGFTVNWSFGDGTHSSAQDPVHSYNAPSNYTVVLVLNSTDYNGSATIYAPINPALQAGVSFVPTNPSTDSDVNFTATPSLGTPPYIGFWNFGDGSTATGLSVLHTFHAAGTYTVRVWANDSGEGSAPQTLQVTVTNGGGTTQPTGNTDILIGTSVAAVGVAVAGFAYFQWDKKRRPKLPTTAPPAAPPPAP